jgi:hypothetical protein
VGRNLDGLWLSGLGEFNISNLEVLAVLGLIEIMSELIYTVNSELSAECIDNATSFDFITCQVVIANEVLTWLIHCKSLRKLLSLE